MNKLNLNEAWCFRLFWSDQVDDSIFLVPKDISYSDIEDIIEDVKMIDDYNIDDFQDCLNERNIPFFAFNIYDIEF